MISRLYIKNHPSFAQTELKFENGLSVFTGVSGAGKSVLMDAILSVFGFKDSEANLIEADVKHKFEMDEFGIENEEINVFKMLRSSSARYFINNQSISKKKLANIAATHLKYLSAKQIDEFENARLLAVLDEIARKQNPKFLGLVEDFRLVFGAFGEAKKELEKINADEAKVDELKEFAAFEIQKIDSVSPKAGELDELLAVKKRISKRDKIEEAWARAEPVFALESAVTHALALSEIDGAFFSDAMNELRAARAGLTFDEMSDDEIEKILDRIEALNSLVKRYGSEEEALAVLETRKKELARYEKIEFEKSELEAKFESLKKQSEDLAEKISTSRAAALGEFETVLNRYLGELYMEKVSVALGVSNLNINGRDEVKISLNEAALKNLSSGEINRLRLAFIASEVEILGFGEGVLILDEIDSNLSGKEAMSIAEVLLRLAKYYQIFAISHQPQLSSKAHHHFLVEKSGGESSVRELAREERVKELSRMISGEKITEEATQFAKKLLGVSLSKV